MAKSYTDEPVGDEVEALDPYTASQQEASSAKRRAKTTSSSTPSSADDDEDEEEETFGPSVEEEIAKQEAHVHGQPITQEAKEEEDELVQERRATDELALLDDLAGQIEDERYESSEDGEEM